MTSEYQAMVDAKAIEIKDGLREAATRACVDHSGLTLGYDDLLGRVREAEAFLADQPNHPTRATLELGASVGKALLREDI